MNNKDDIAATRIMLLGGFGNQLFQLAHGLNSEETSKVVLIRYENPNNHDLDTSLNDFLLPRRVKIQLSPSPSKLILRLRNLGLGVGSHLNGELGISKIMALPILILSCLIYVISGVKFSFSLGVGKSHASIGMRKAIKVGYFQCTQNTRVISEMQHIVLKKSSKALNKMLQMHTNSKFLAVHVRLGDYTSDKKIGVPDEKYFNSAIRVAQSTGDYDSILVFSNDIAEAQKLIKFPEHIKIIFVHEDLLTTSETFELMRHASGYVISNSTYSWWAAMLSYNSNPEVICPEPWFDKLSEPVGLIPENWIRLDRKSGLKSHNA